MKTTPDTTDTIDFRALASSRPLIGLLRLLARYRWLYLGAVISLALAALARSATYLLIGYFTDHILGQGTDLQRIPWFALAFVALAALTGAFTFLSGALAARTSETIARQMRDFIFDHLQRLPFQYHDQAQTGDLIQRATSDIDAVRRFFADQAIGVGRILLLFSVNLAALILLNARLALLSIVVVPFVVLLSYLFFRRVSQAYEAYQEQESVLSSTLQENLSGVRVVKAFGRQRYERKKFKAVNWEKYRRGKRLLLMHSLYWPVSDILTGAQMLGGYALGAWMALQGEISLGDYLAYLGLLVWILWPIRNMGRLIVQMSTGLVSFGRVMEIARQPVEPLEEGDYLPQRIRGEFEFRGVGFAYEAGQPVLRDISFHCRPGEVIALLGSTGSGKSTLANLIPRFYDYTEGSILLDGVELKRYPRAFLRKHIGIVEQEPFLFSRTIRENITYGVERPVSEEEIVAAAKIAAIHENILRFPQGYDTLVGERGVTLSGGQKQRLALARAIIKNPPILILDDATSSVDLETESAIRAALEALTDRSNGRQRTTFVIAHRVQSVMNADRILVLDKGRIVQQGKHEELIAQEGPYQRIFAIQAMIEEELEQDLASALAGTEEAA